MHGTQLHDMLQELGRARGEGKRPTAWKVSKEAFDRILAEEPGFRHDRIYHLPYTVVEDQEEPFVLEVVDV